MQEETDAKEELRDQKIYGQKKIFLKKDKKVDLTNPKYNLHTHQYPITYMRYVNFEKKSLVLLIINNCTLVCMDDNMEEVKLRLDFNIDYVSHYNKIMDGKYKVFDYEQKRKENAMLAKKKFTSPDAKGKKKKDDTNSPRKTANHYDKNFCNFKYNKDHKNID